ncbi:MAG: hypothetical protein QOI38_863 [Sphingomonadales bacterium]|jgi:hypothetical protein|nr:hypothetical protein [Sphingomonadales bacterium]
MAELVKARLIEMEDAEKEKSGVEPVIVQFNPDSLKVTFANQIVQPQGGDQSSGPTGQQFVGAGTTKLALTLWFDATAMTDDPVDDVRRLTSQVIYFITPKEDKTDKKKFVPPLIRFSWGSFLFDGIVEGLEESLEYFAPDGKPLRASISLTLSQQKILVSKFGDPTKVPSKAGHAPLSPAKAGDSLQSMAGGKGKDGGWQGIAAANGIEDPLRLKPGQLINLDASTAVAGGFGASAGAALTAGVVATPQITLPGASARFGLN